jgi:hypothetical protein
MKKGMTPEEMTLFRIKALKKDGIKLKYQIPYKSKDREKEIIYLQLRSLQRRKTRGYMRALDTSRNAHKMSYKIRKFFRKLFCK